MPLLLHCKIRHGTASNAPIVACGFARQTPDKSSAAKPGPQSALGNGVVGGLPGDSPPQPAMIAPNTTNKTYHLTIMPLSVYLVAALLSWFSSLRLCAPDR